MNPNNFDVLKIADKSFATIGDTINYTVVLINNGTVTNNNIILTDLIPQGANFSDNSVFINGVNFPGYNTALGITVPNMPVNAISTITFQATVVNNPANPSMQNAAQLDYQFLEAASIVSASIDTNRIVTIDNTAVLNLVKVAPITANLGQSTTFTITIRNVGTTTATTIKFFDTIPPGTTFVPSSTRIDGVTTIANPTPPIGVTIPDIAPAGTRTVRFSVLVVSVPSNTINNIGNSTYSYLIDPVTIRTGFAAANSNTTVTTLTFANLSGITKAVNKTIGVCGDILTYIIAVPNSGSLAATNVIISDTLPSGVVFVPGTLFVDNIPRVDLLNNINIGTIFGGAISTVTFQAQISC